MRTLLAIGLVAAAAGLAAADDATMKALAGKWEVIGVVRNGAADDGLKGAIREHADAKYTITPAPGSKAPAVTGAFVLDAKKSPVAIDMKPTGGQFKDKTLHGIVKVDGDRLTIAFAPPGKARPTAFESAPGSDVVVAVHKKVK